ncbi:unnamed protein product [Linum tenue]|uniref:NADP-dependent oxidoreductase domain-containing protein n=1 Tax=Linum tenue TaxID=586396 RepID=A0AAV0L202_9ROSI|nr:unnamed protein product [Linum tenue]
MAPLCLPETWAAMEALQASGQARAIGVSNFSTKKLKDLVGSPGSWVKGEILKEPVLIEIAEKLKKSPAQVALRWGIQSGHSVLPKSVNESRLKENISLFDWCIPLDLFSKFSEVHQVSILT